MSKLQILLIAGPPVLLLSTFQVFRETAARYGPARAYLVGFLFYWIGWCSALPILTVGVAGFGQMFGSPDPPLGRPVWLGAILLVGPPLAMLVTRFPSSIHSASVAFVIASALYAVANGTMEEILWRGTYMVAFPGSWFWSWIYPSIWFGFWHLSPQAVQAGGVTGEALTFAIMSIALGLVWGHVARTSGSIRWTVAAHILLNLAVPAGAWFVGRA